MHVSNCFIGCKKNQLYFFLAKCKKGNESHSISSKQGSVLNEVEKSLSFAADYCHTFSQLHHSFQADISFKNIPPQLIQVTKNSICEMLRKNAPNILQQFLLYYRKKGCISFEIQKENMLPKVTKGLWFFMYV